MWFRYKKSLIKCKANEYEDFVYNLYLRDLNNKIVLTRKKPEKDVYSAILKRAEKGYFKKEIFD